MAGAPVVAYVALGSNLGDRAAHLAAALSALRASEGVSVRDVSSVYETAPVGGPPQGAYLNAAVAIETTLSPHALLALLLAIEAGEGRRRDGVRNAPRSLDLDLLLYASEIVSTSELELPHPRLHERAFVLEPLREIAPALVHPRLHERIDRLAAGAARGAPLRRLELPLG